MRFHFVVFISIALLFLVLRVDSFDFWATYTITFFIFLLVQLRNSILKGFPLAEIITISYLVQNSLAIVVLQILDGQNYVVGDDYYLMVPINQYLPFSVISISFFYLGTKSVSLPNERWYEFVITLTSKMKLKEVYFLLAIGVLGLVSKPIVPASFQYVSTVLAQIFPAALLTYTFYSKKIFNIYFLIGLIFEIYAVIEGGMFGSFIYFIIYYGLLFLMLLSIKGYKIPYAYAFMAAFVGILLFATLQNIKIDYRKKIWDTESINNAIDNDNKSEFFKSISLVFSGEVFSKDYYIPLVTRLNQGWLVSAVMEKVPAEEPFAKGETLITSARDAFVPRYFMPDKEEAGGRAKIKRFTNKPLVGFTSMNIGLLGESYANFGTVFGSLFFLLWGCFLSNFERKILNASKKHPLFLIAFTIYFGVFITSESDFLYILNTITKATLVLILINYLLRSFVK